MCKGHRAGAEESLVLTFSSFPRKQRGSGSLWGGTSFLCNILERRKEEGGRIRGAGIATSPVFRGAQKCTESSRLSYCIGIIMAAIFVHLFNNVNLATA